MTACPPARNAWLVAGLLLLVAGGLTAVSYVAHWWPCFDGGMRSELCLRRRDTWLTPPYMADPPDRVPWVTGPVSVGSLLAGLSWLVAMRAVPFGRVGRVLGLLVAAQAISIGVWSVVSAFTPLIEPELGISTLWNIGGELLAIALGVGLVLAAADEEKAPWRLVWPLIALVGATTIGLLRWSGELLAFNGHLGDGYPRRGAGLGLAATLLLCGAALVVRSRLRTPTSTATPSADERARTSVQP